MKKLIFITPSLTGEFSRHEIILRMIKTLKSKMINFYFIEYKPKNFTNTNKSKLLEKYKIPISKNIFFKKFQILKIFFKVNSQDYILVGGYGHLECWIFLIIGIVRGCKRVGWLGGSKDTIIHKNKFFLYLKIFFLNQLNSIVTYGLSSSEFYKSLLKNKKNIFTGINCSDTEFFSKFTTKRSISFSPKKRIKCLWVGRLIERKGLINLINNILEDQELYKKIELTIVGSGPLEEKIQKIIKDHKSLLFVGSGDEQFVAKQFQKCDLFIQSTFYDPYSRVLSEASSAGLYIISSIYDKSIEVLEEGVNFSSYDPKDKNSFKKSFEKSLNILKKKNYRKVDLSEISPFSVNRYSQEICKAILHS